jgi:hypothetical protein
MTKRRRQFWKKKAKKKMKKKIKTKHVGKVKAKFLTSSILKKKFDKDNFEKKYMRKHCSKTKII